MLTARGSIVLVMSLSLAMSNFCAKIYFLDVWYLSVKQHNVFITRRLAHIISSVPYHLFAYCCIEENVIYLNLFTYIYHVPQRWRMRGLEGARAPLSTQVQPSSPKSPFEIQEKLTLLLARALQTFL